MSSRAEGRDDAVGRQASSVSRGNRRQLEFLRDIYEVSAACSTKSYIWGGLTIDIMEGRFLREHGGMDVFTLNLLELKDDLSELYVDRGYQTEFLPEWHMLQIRRDGHSGSFNCLEIDHGVAMWRHIGEHGTVYFPASWLEDVPRRFYDVMVHISGVEFEYSIKSNVRLLSPEWQLRPKDREAREYLEGVLQERRVEEEDVLKHIWSHNPFWVRKGYQEYAMPVVAWPLLPRGVEVS